MKISRTTIAAAITTMLVAGACYAQQPVVSGLPYPAFDYVPSQPAAYEYDHYYTGSTQPSPSDAPAPGGGSCAPCEPVCANPCDACCNGCDEEPFKLFTGCCFDRWGLDMGGWMSMSIFGNAHAPRDRFNGPVTFNDRSGEYQLNQIWLYAGRAVDTGGSGTDLGGRVDFLYGTDWRFTPAVGLEVNKDGTLNWNQDHRFYGAALPQLYAEFGYNDLSVKVGHFFTIIGYEVVQATGNFFTTHAYTHQYGEPFTHTGVLGSYALTENFSIVSGLHRGWDQWQDLNNTIGLLQGFTFNLGEGTSLAIGYTWSEEPTDTDLKGDRNMYSIVFSHQLYENLLYVFEHDLGWQQVAVEGADGGIMSAEWYGINQYLIYDINDQWALGLRGEWFRDDDGYRVAGLGTPLGYTSGGFAGNFYEIALGLNYRPCPNIIVRNEVRWDWYDGADGESDDPANGPRPFDDGNKDRQFLFGTNLIMTY